MSHNKTIFPKRGTDLIGIRTNHNDLAGLFLRRFVVKPPITRILRGGHKGHAKSPGFFTKVVVKLGFTRIQRVEKSAKRAKSPVFLLES